VRRPAVNDIYILGSLTPAGGFVLKS